jgi:hypothetical protein
MAENESYGVKSTHPEYDANLLRWQKVRAVLDANCKPYLRNVGASEPEPKIAKQRQAEYEDGAIFYNFTKRTLSGMVGAVMRKDPEVKLPTQLEYLLENCDGSGIGLEQHAQDALNEIDSLGRGGLLVDAPQTAAATRAEQNAGRLNPRILFYTTENIRHWHYRKVGSTNVLDMVILREQYEYQVDGNEFWWECGELYRVLEIVDGVYRQRIFTFGYDGEQIAEEIIEMSERRADIPFTFIGSDNNDGAVDTPPLDALCDVNIGHYRNSADVEDSSFICSQPTLMIYPGENMSPDIFKELNPKGIRVGSRTGHNLGAGGAAELIQAQESNLALKLMEQKENQAVMIGAQLITPTIQVTAEAARLQRGADTSIMATIAKNVSMAYEQAIGWCAEMIGASGEIVFELNTEFFMQQLTAQDRAAWIADINAGLLPARSYYAAMRAAGATNWTDAEIEEELERMPPAPAPTLNTQVSGEIPEAPTIEEEQQ